MSRSPLAPTLAACLAALLALPAAIAPRTARAQLVVPVATPDSVAIDAALARARARATEGDLAGARAVLDSLANATPAGTNRLAEVLFWRATYAQTAAGAERDYRRIVVEHPMSPRAEDGLLRLAQLELARGDQQLAIRHLERLVLEHPGSANRARARYWTARAWMDAGDVGKGCGALGEALASAGGTDAELRNQVRYAGQRCPAGWDAAATTSVAAVPSQVAPAESASVAIAGAASGVSGAASGVSGASRPAAGGPPPNTTIAPAPRESVTTNAPVVPAARADSAARRGSPPDINIPPSRPAPVTASAPPASSARPAVVVPPLADVPGNDWARAKPTTVTTAKPPATTPAATTTAKPPVKAPVAAPATNPAPPSAAAAAAPTPARSGAGATAPARRTIYSVQLAAYDTRADAEALARRLTSRGLAARVSGDVAPFRVRVGRYATRAEAVKELAALKAKGLAGFVADEVVEGAR